MVPAKMTRYLALTLGCLLCTLSLSTGDEVPSIAISCGNTPLDALPKYQQSMDTLGFKKLLSSLWNEDTKVLMVLEDELSLEDFTLKDTHGHSLFQLFENAENRRFFPSVDQPENAIAMLSKNGFSVKAYNDETYTNTSDKVIALADLSHNDDDSRQSVLLKHNNDISKIYNNLCTQYTNVVLVLSGKLNPWIEKTEASNAHHLVTRHLMALESNSEKFKLTDPEGMVVIYSASNPTLSIDNGPESSLQATNNPFIDKSSKDTDVKALKVGDSYTYNNSNSKVTLRFRFQQSSTFEWELPYIEYENLNIKKMLTPPQKITAQMGLSYFSQGPVIFSNDSIVLKFNNEFQAQPWTSSKGKFTDQEQDSFFTAPILAGLFVIGLMLFIVTWGITMIMDIKTMDRFDDPKGKTISINVAE